MIKWLREVAGRKQRIKELERQVEGWAESAAMFHTGQTFYHNIVIQIGEMFGHPAYVSDDGSVQSQVLALKVPELVKESLSVAPLTPVCYVMSKPHLNGYQVILGFSKSDEATTAHYFLSRAIRQARWLDQMAAVAEPDQPVAQAA